MVTQRHWQRLEGDVALFLAGPARNQWFMYSQFVTLYLRKRPRVLLAGGTRIDALDVANFTVHCRKNQGVGTRVLTLLHTLNPYDVTYIENVMTDRWATHLAAAGWTRDTRLHVDRCFYRKTK